MSSTFRPSRRTRAAAWTACGSVFGSAGTGRGGAPSPPSSQAVSAGRIRVATRPGDVRAAWTATAASAPTSRAETAVRTQAETPRAQPSASAVSGGAGGGGGGGLVPAEFADAQAPRGGGGRG